MWKLHPIMLFLQNNATCHPVCTKLLETIYQTQKRYLMNVHNQLLHCILQNTFLHSVSAYSYMCKLHMTYLWPLYLVLCTHYQVLSAQHTFHFVLESSLHNFLWSKWQPKVVCNINHWFVDCGCRVSSNSFTLTKKQFEVSGKPILSYSFWFCFYRHIPNRS